jgi:ABC-type multidrug transport system ATPase subunit
MPLTVSSLRQRYGSALILEGVGFEIAPFSCMALLGRNGAGKTTLLRTLMGVMPSDGGTIGVYCQSNGRKALQAEQHGQAPLDAILSMTGVGAEGGPQEKGVWFTWAIRAHKLDKAE